MILQLRSFYPSTRLTVPSFLFNPSRFVGKIPPGHVHRVLESTRSTPAASHPPKPSASQHPTPPTTTPTTTPPTPPTTTPPSTTPFLTSKQSHEPVASIKDRYEQNHRSAWIENDIKKDKARLDARLSSNNLDASSSRLLQHALQSTITSESSIPVQNPPVVTPPAPPAPPPLPLPSSTPSPSQAQTSSSKTKPSLMKEQVTPPPSLITKDTTADQITDAVAIKELVQRGLAHLDPENKTATSFTVEDGSNILVGGSKYGAKLDEKGMAYATATESKSHDNGYIPNPTKAEDVSFMIIAPPPSNPDLVLETGLNKHLLITHNTATGEFYAFGYLTSKNTGVYLCDQQLKVYQKQQEQLTKEEIPTKGKVQYFKPFEYAIKIDPKDIVRVKGDTEYLAKTPKEAYMILKELWGTVSLLPTKIFNKSGITRAHAIEICKEYDATVRNKGKHPLTAEQFKQQEKGKEKQRELNEEKKKKKEKEKEDRRQKETQQENEISND